jgi:uncharacterized membrane protein
MATSTPTGAPKTLAEFAANARKSAEPYLVPYYLTVVAVIGALTTVFVLLTVVIILVATNFNVLALIE